MAAALSMYSLQQHRHSTTDCNAINRVTKALRYYGKLDIMSDENDKELLLRFFNETYLRLLDDYIHIVTEHNSNDDLQDIINAFIGHFGSRICDITNCKSAIRHYRTRYDEQDDHKQINDNQLLFYRDIMDSIHCYLLHSFDTAFRIKHDDIKYDGDDVKNDAFDGIFANICNIVQAKKSKLELLKNYRQNRKFSAFYNQYNGGEQDILFQDALFEFLEENGNISQTEIKRIKEFFEEEEFDSDAIMDDVENFFNEHDNIFGTNSNIAAVNQQKCNRIIKKYAHSVKLHEYSFSMGYTFYYWSYYRDHKMNQNHYWNENDYSEYGGSPLDVYVDKKYASIKHEILNNTIYSLTLYQYTMSFYKACKYINTNQAKNSKTEVDDYLNYGIPKGTLLSINNLLCITLYCDWSDLCTSFSSTFRKMKPYESICSVKKRNREFYHWSKILRETVEFYGSTPCDKQQSIEWNRNNNHVQGPFFHGLSYHMVLPTVTARLCAPTSTSKVIEVATHFAGDQGIIIQLNNNGTMHDSNIRSFGCNWLSKYSSEHEWLFCGGHQKIRIDGVRIIESRQNFDRFFSALFYFDCMISGAQINGISAEKIDDTEYTIISNLMKSKNNYPQYINKYPRYINNTFMAYTNHKSEIVLNLRDIQLHFNQLSHLAISTDNTTTIKAEFVRLFPNLKRIIVHDQDKESAEMMDLSSLYNVPGFEMLNHSSDDNHKQVIRCSMNPKQQKNIGYNTQIMCEFDLIINTMYNEDDIIDSDAFHDQLFSKPLLPSTYQAKQCPKYGENKSNEPNHGNNSNKNGKDNSSESNEQHNNNNFSGGSGNGDRDKNNDNNNNKDKNNKPTDTKKPKQKKPHKEKKESDESDEDDHKQNEEKEILKYSISLNGHNLNWINCDNKRKQTASRLRANAATFTPYIRKTQLQSIVEIAQQPINEVFCGKNDAECDSKNDDNAISIDSNATQTTYHSIKTHPKKQPKPKKSKRAKKVQQRNIVPHYESIMAIRARANVYISREMTTKIISNRIKQQFSNLFFMMDISTAMQFQDYKKVHHNYGYTPFKILNYGFLDTENDDKLYCIIKAQDKSIKENNGKKWEMMEELFNKTQIAQQYGVSANKLPVSSHLHQRYLLQLDYIKNIKILLKNKTKTQTFIKNTAWHKLNVFKKSNPKRRMMLSLPKMEFIRQFEQYMKRTNGNDMILIPILMFDIAKHWIEHILIITVDTNINIGISLKYEFKKNTIKATGIHLDKEFIHKQHISALPQHQECKCLDNFESNINDMRVGNVMEMENKFNALKKDHEDKCNEWIRQKAEMEQLIAQLRENAINCNSPQTLSSSNIILSSSSSSICTPPTPINDNYDINNNFNGNLFAENQDSNSILSNNDTISTI